MGYLAILCLAVLLPTTAEADDTDAKNLAQDILTKGAALFDVRDAAAMAATYVEDAEVIIVIKDKDTGTFKTQVSRGRSAIENGYQNIFKDRKPGTKSRNLVEYAHFVGTDLMIVHGSFTLDVSQGVSLPFVQVRAKRGEKWLIMSLQIFVVSEQTG
jgi:hypothetical protein